MKCDEVRSADLTGRYVRGELSDAEQDAFERHCLDCPACLEHVEAHWALYDELKRSAPAIENERIPTRRPSRWTWVAAAAAAAAVLVVGIVTWNTGEPGDRPQGAGPASASIPASPGMPGPAAPASPPAPAGAAAEDPVALLARFDPPQYVPLTLRGSDEAASLFERGMQDYMRRDYAQAATRLQRAAGLAPQAAHITFFLGISHLMSGRTDAGIEWLQHTARTGDPDYQADAQFYLAKARLSRRDVSGARRELEAVVKTGEPDRQAEAREMLRRLR